MEIAAKGEKECQVDDRKSNQSRIMTSTSLDMESLISIYASEESFYEVISHIQSLYHYLKENKSTTAEEDYRKLMAHLIEQYLDEKKQSFLRHHLGEKIARATKDEYAARYFKKKIASIEMIEVLKQHNKLTGKRLMISSVDYEEQKFKLKTV